jgi:DNA-binding beta-propeller fold protein YncE
VGYSDTPIVSVVDLSTNQVIKNFDLRNGNSPYPSCSFCGAITPNLKYLLVSNPFTSILSKLDLQTGTIINI